jgi:hypothetical protein
VTFVAVIAYSDSRGSRSISIESPAVSFAPFPVVTPESPRYTSTVVGMMTSDCPAIASVVSALIFCRVPPTIAICTP